MATKTPVLTDKAPKPLPGIYSQAIIANGVVYCSGAVAMDPITGKLVDGDVKAHTVRRLQFHDPARKLIHVSRNSTNVSKT